MLSGVFSQREEVMYCILIMNGKSSYKEYLLSKKENLKIIAEAREPKRFLILCNVM